MKDEVMNQRVRTTLERKPMPKEPQRRRLTATVSRIAWHKGQQRIFFGTILDENGQIIAQRGSVNYPKSLRQLELKPGCKITFDAIAHFERIAYWFNWVMKGNIIVASDLWMSRPCNLQIDSMPIEEDRFVLRQQRNQLSPDQ